MSPRFRDVSLGGGHTVTTRGFRGNKFDIDISRRNYVDSLLGNIGKLFCVVIVDG